MLAARQIDDHVGPDAPLVAVQRLLLVEIAVIEHAGELDDPLQLELAPAAADTGPLQRIDQTAGFGLQLAAGRVERRDALQQRRALLDAPALGVLDLAVHPIERGLHRREQILDRFLAGVDVRCRLGSGGAQPLSARWRNASLLVFSASALSDWNASRNRDSAS